LSDEQRLLQDTVRRLLDEAYPTTRAREISDTADAHDAALHATGVLAVTALRECGNEPLCKELLPEIAAGRTRIGVALAESYAVRDGAGVRLERGRLEGTALFALDSVGADRLLVHCAGGLALAYASERKQFGRVIGSFQAVKHMLAEIAAALEPARSLAWYAAHAFEHEPADASRLAALAKAHVSEVATEILRKATEVHGGIGFTEQYDLHLWFRRVTLSRPLLGGPELLRDEAARLRGWTS